MASRLNTWQPKGGKSRVKAEKQIVPKQRQCDHGKYYSPYEDSADRA